MPGVDVPLTRPCRSCGRPGTRAGICPSCKATLDARRDLERGTPDQRGYDAEHRRRAGELRRLGRPCCLCGQPIDYTLRAPHPMSFSAHHLTPDKRGPIDAAHLVHNQQAGKPKSAGG